MVIWIIGLSGAGKTTLAEEVVKILRKRGKSLVLLDGDSVRELFGNDLGHDSQGRYANAERICRMCKFLDEQSIDVVCAILSIFPESRNWCRNNLSDYYEIFIDSPIDLLMQRDSKGLYGRYQRGEIHDVAGLDLHFPRPENPDVIISNVGSKQTLLNHAMEIADKIFPEDL